MLEPLNSPSSGKPSKLLDAKLRKFFGVLDTNGDGLVTREDHEEMGRRFAAASDVNDKRKEEIKQHFITIWETIFHRDGKVEEVDMPYFVDLMTSHGLSGMKKICDGVTPIMFQAVDADGDGKIQPAEFRHFFALFKCNDSGADRSFGTIDADGDGVLSGEEFRVAFTDFLCDEDETCPNRLFFGPLDE